MKEIIYKGKGEHNVYQLEAIIEQREERIHHLCLEDAGLLAEIRNKMNLVTNFMGLYNAHTGMGPSDDNLEYVRNRLPKAFEEAKESIKWLRDDNNF